MRGASLSSPTAPWLALGATVVWSWVWLGAAVLTGRPWLAFPTVLLTVTGLLGPVIVPSVVIARGAWHESVTEFWRRCLGPRTLAPRWWAVTTGVVALLVVGTSTLSGQVQLQLGSGPAVFLLVGFLAGAVEEPGWRGYGLTALQERMPALAAALVVGGFWVAWHLPLFWLEGTYQATLGIGTARFWTFHLALLAGSPIYAWLLNASGGVVFSVVWFHAAGNLAREALLAGADPRVELAVEAAIAMVLVTIGWRLLRRPIPRRVGP